MEVTYAIIILLLIVAGWCLWMKSPSSIENLSGYGVTSALAFNNRLAYCQKGNDMYGGSWSGGCFLPHRVIL